MTAMLRKKVCLYCLFLLSITLSNAYANNTPEYYAKAAFLFKVIDFVTWPNNGNIKKICVYGENQFKNYLQEIANARNKDNSIVLHYTQDFKTINDCHILFIGQSEKYQLSNLLHHLKKKPILTVSDIRKFAYKKGMIELDIHSRKRNFKLKMNLGAVNESGIKLSSNLIELATITYGYNNMVQSE